MIILNATTWISDLAVKGHLNESGKGRHIALPKSNRY